MKNSSYCIIHSIKRGEIKRIHIIITLIGVIGSIASILSLFLSSNLNHFIFDAKRTVSTSENKSIEKIAVLKFNNNSGETKLDWLGSGLAETISTELAADNKRFLVIERLQIEEVKKELNFQKSGYVDESTAVEIGKILGADSVIVGSYQKFGTKCMINIRQVKVETGEIINVINMDGNFDEIFEIQKQIAINTKEILTN